MAAVSVVQVQGKEQPDVSVERLQELVAIERAKRQALEAKLAAAEAQQVELANEMQGWGSQLQSAREALRVIVNKSQPERNSMLTVCWDANCIIPF